MTSDRRQHPRHLVAIPARVTTGGATHGAVIKDISEGGVGIEFMFAKESDRLQFDIGSAIAIAPDSGATRTGRVVREYVNGVGVKFDD